MMTFKKRGFWFGVVGALFSLPLVLSIWVSTGEAQTTAANAYVTTNVNQRAGPGTQYPVIVTVPARAYVTIYSCIRNYAWCDVGYQNSRGWMLATYLQAYYGGRYMPVAEFGPLARLPVVAFDINAYWPTYYRNQPFYRDMARWSTPPRPAVTVNAFYRPLSPYGSWVWLRGQYVWVPDRVEARWRPYTEGRWVYTNPYGWTWISDEPFGWATYHYGRWGFSKTIGWFWVPGTRWAPAWVTWRGSDDYLAWAPLPPSRGDSISIEITIGDVPDYYWQVVPSSAFLSVNLSRQIIRDNKRFVPIFEDTRPVGNVTIVNNVVVNNVINVQYVEQKTQETVVVHEVAATGNPDQAGKVEDGTLQVLTATLAAPAEAAVTEVPPEVKTVEEVAAVSQTNEQAGDQLATEQLVVPPAEAEPTLPPVAEPAPPPPAIEPAPPPPEQVPPTPALEPAAPAEPPPPPAEQAAPPAVEQPVPVEAPPAPELPAPPPAPEPVVPAEPAPPPPPPPAVEEAPAEQPPQQEQPPPAIEEVPAEQPPEQEQPAPPPPPTVEEPAPGCPEGTTLLDDGNCSAPAQPPVCPEGTTLLDNGTCSAPAQ